MRNLGPLKTSNFMKAKYLLALLPLALSGCLPGDPNYAAGTLSPLISIKDVRDLYRGTDVVLEPSQLSGAHQISGIVVSDAAGGNVPGGAGSLVVQSRRNGIVRGLVLPLQAASGAPALAVGDSVVVNVQGATLARSGGQLQVRGLTPGDVQKVSSNNRVVTQDVSIGALRANPGAYEGTLVRLSGAGFAPAPPAGATYAGDKTLADGSGKQLVLHTEAAASFASRRVPASATFLGVAVGDTTAGPPQLWMRTIADAVDPSGAIYAGFPESFEAVPQATKASYNMNTAAVPDNTVTFGTGPWKLYQAILGNTAGRDRYTGTQGIRLQQGLSEPAVVEMKFDLLNGASKLTLLYGAYYTDAASSWKLEYSQDQGKTWKQTGPTVTDAGNWQHSLTFLLNISGPVRFRLNKLGLGASAPPAVLNGRLGLDDIAIYEN